MPFRYRIFGVARERESGRPLPGLRVCAFDMDLILDDDLGEVTTDERGEFRLVFTEVAFQEPGDGRPDIYLRVFDPTGRREIHQTRDAIRYEANADEHFELEIPAAALEGSGGPRR